ncbi:MAG: cytochrome c5 family protein [Alphaproteobacteria bacterium]|nr:cytochrome c5 family protein [Alphaproteobacteria bacterium]
MRRGIPATAMLLAAACVRGGTGAGDNAAPPPPSGAVLAYAETALPADARLAAIYERSCRNCHSVRETGAPLTGDAPAWRARIEAKGLDGLVASARTGLNAMPPMGLCPDCTDEDFRALIEFMATEAK